MLVASRRRRRNSEGIRRNSEFRRRGGFRSAKGRRSGPGREACPRALRRVRLKPMTSDSTSARGGVARGAPINLRDAPASLFADDFARLAALKGGEAEALEALDRPDPGILAFYRREALAFGALSVGRRQEAEAQEDADLLARTLVPRIRDSAAAGLLAAAGLFARTGLRQEISPELWAEAKIEFAAGRLTLGEFAYAGVTVSAAAPDEPAAQDDPAAALSAFLEDRRRRQGDELKKALREASRERFKEAFTVRRFDAAYAAVYGRRRGRPNKSTSK